MSITTVIVERSLAPDTWLWAKADPTIVEHDGMVSAMKYLLRETEKLRGGSWTFHIYDSRGARYTLMQAYAEVFGAAPKSTPSGYRFPLLERA